MPIHLGIAFISTYKTRKMRKITSLGAVLTLFVALAGTNAVMAQNSTTVTLDAVGSPVTSLEEIVDGGKYMIWMEANTGADRHGLVYVKEHTCSAGSGRVAANDGVQMPVAGAEVDATSVFTVEVQTSGDGTPCFAFRVSDGKYISAANPTASTAGTPIHESDVAGWFTLGKDGAGSTVSEADLWIMKTTDNQTNRVFVNTGGADTGGLVLYANANGSDDNNSRLKIIPVGHTVALSATSNLGNVATFSHNYGSALVAPENVKVYKAGLSEESETTVELLEVASRVIPANQGVILVGTDAVRANLVETEATAGSDEYAGNRLVGLPAGGTPEAGAASTVYVFTKGANDEAMFKLYDGQGAFGSNKAYLELNGTATHVMSIGFGGEATGIGQAPVASDDTAPMYDLSGRRVWKVAAGSLYIQGGRKYFAK